jgi:catechol 2,3-dioxygenase-like lactoylglutathione lyase family enzyme
MKRTAKTNLALVFLVAVPHVASAQFQPIPAKDAPVSYIHHHLYVANLDVQKKFWVDTLGGTFAGKLLTLPVEIVKFRNVQVLLSPQPPTGGSKGTTVNHIGFQVPNLRAMVDKLKAAGYPIVTRAELPETIKVTDDLGFVPDQNTYIAFVMAPDDVKVEFIENKSMDGPLLSHHVHFAAPNVDEMRAWYVKAFGAVPGKRGSFEAADVPGINLTFAPARETVVPTRGRAFDHIGFEIKNLEQFCKDLEAKGIKLDRGYAKAPGSTLAVAFLTDPWGTKIELTEGLDKP